MTDTYQLGQINNKRLNSWTAEGYQKTTGRSIKDRLANNQISTISTQYNGNETPDINDIQKLQDNEDILVLEEQRRVTEATQEEKDLRQERQQKIQELKNKQRQLNKARTKRKENKNDLQGLENEMKNLQNRLQEINNRFKELGLNPPIISRQDINQLNQSNQQEANNLLSERGRISNRIGNLNNEISNLQNTVQQQTQEVDQIRSQRNNLRNRIQEIDNQLEGISKNVTVKQILLDIILVCTTQWETYISGEYIPPNSNQATRRIMGQATKQITIGARAPITIRDTRNEENFWDNIYSSIREEIFNSPGGFPEGELFTRLTTELQNLSGIAANTGSFTGSHWNWEFGKKFNQGSGTHQFPSENQFTSEKNKRCENWDDLKLR